jgi:hypothetical protein
MANSNREKLDKLSQKFGEWLHLEDPYLIPTLSAMKVSHKIPGDPIWLLLIGPSSGGKTECLRALQQKGELNVDDLTEHTFVSGYRSKEADKEAQFAAKLSGRLWYIFDLSILLSKNSEERSSILSDMRMVYDGKVTKVFGNKQQIEVECPGNTLICGTTPVIDNTILEDQQLGTRFITYRLKASNRHAMMDMIDRNQDRMVMMRENLNLSIREFEQSIDYTPYILTDVDNQNLQIMSNMTTLLRTSISLDKQGEPSNLSYPEEPGRLYKQMKKLYSAYRMIGLSEEESLRCIRKICQDNVNPIRVRLLKYMFDNNKVGGRADFGENYFTTTQIHIATGLGKKTVKSHLHTLHMLSIVNYDCEENQFGQIVKDKWSLLDANLSLLLSNGVKFNLGRSMWPIYKKSQKRPSPENPPTPTFEPKTVYQTDVEHTKQ